MTAFDVRAHAATAGVTRLEFVGEIDIAVVGQVSDAIRQALTDATTAELVIDLDAVTFLDSTGIGAFMTGRLLAQERAVTYRLVNVRGPVERVLSLTGVLTVLTDPTGTPAAS
jgi:anti-sigma B factor antagonist